MRRFGIAARGPAIRSCTTHVVIANLVQADDGRWSALDGRRIYAHAKTAGYLYEARLRAELTRALELEWTRVRNGIADVVGVPAEVLRAFSRRRAEIEAELERTGQAGPRAAQTATLETRRRKARTVTPERLDHDWLMRAAELGFTRAAISALPTSARTLTASQIDSFLSELAGEHGLTAQQSTFTRRELIQALCERLPAGAPLDVAHIESLADRFLASPDAIVLALGEPAAARDALLRRADGRLVRALPDERRYTTRELLQKEQLLVRLAEREVGVGVAVASPRAVDRALRARPTLAKEQADLVRRLCGEGHRVAVIVGPAGTGKTFALDAAREAWEASGTPVVGAAIAWRAARSLEEGAGIPATSVASLVARTERRPLPRGVDVVVDEAGMVGTRDLVRLHWEARRSHGKLVLVGDDRQLPEIDAGGAFAGLRRRLPIIELRDKPPPGRGLGTRGLVLLRQGDGRAALDRYEAHGRIRTGAPDVAREQLVRDWWQSGGPDGGIMLAYRRADVADLNRRARGLMAAAGALAGPELVIDRRPCAAGDQVLLRRNDRRLGVANGDRGRVVGIDVAGRTITTRVRGRDVALPLSYLDSGRLLQHGYAMTGHAAQGLTVDR